MRHAVVAAYGSVHVAANRTLAGLLALATVTARRPCGEALVLTPHRQARSG